MISCRYLLLSIVLWLSVVPFSGYSQTQQGVWNAGAASKKSKHKLKDFKDHLQQWGLDSNYNHAFLAGGKLNSDGWSGSVYFVTRKSYKLSNFWEISFSEIKHEKQVKQQGQSDGFTYLGNPTPYVFGKINNLYTLQAGFGKEKLILPAVMEGNISVAFRYSGGLSLAMLKPYYLKLIYINNQGGNDTAHLEQQKYSNADSTEFLNSNTILGAAAWTTGLNQVRYVPGAYLQVGVAIIPGNTKAFVQVITLGINAAYYSRNLSIMAQQQAYPWDVQLFAGLAIGKRWK